MKTDRRQLNKVSWMRNPQGIYYVFGEVGSGKNSYVTTLAMRKTKPAILKVHRKYESYIGTPIRNVPKNL